MAFERAFMKQASWTAITIVDAARKVRQKRFVLDGEAVVLGIDASCSTAKPSCLASMVSRLTGPLREDTSASAAFSALLLMESLQSTVDRQASAA
ncbi:hypothetical protein AB8Z38_21050 [Bradyrhizobium sp. LLZ17]|uniref:Uncharacterized protein n=1 Tax=Bradyrhizobium sp. LLZ17 TaxID=3239388 RepID=A0AB39XBD2_9BRAD